MPPKLYSHYVNMDNGRRAIRSELAGYCLMLAVSGQENRRELRLLRPTTHPPNMPEIGMFELAYDFCLCGVAKIARKTPTCGDLSPAM